MHETELELPDDCSASPSINTSRREIGQKILIADRYFPETVKVPLWLRAHAPFVYGMGEEGARETEITEAQLAEYVDFIEKLGRAIDERFNCHLSTELFEDELIFLTMKTSLTDEVVAKVLYEHCRDLVQRKKIGVLVARHREKTPVPFEV